MHLRPLSVIGMLFLAACTSAGIRHDSLIQNPTLATDSHTQTAPHGWRIDGEAEDVRLDDSAKRDGRSSLRVKFKAGASYAGVVQRLAAAQLGGQTLTMEGWLARDAVAAPVGVWIRAFDKDGNSVAYANSYDSVTPSDGSFARHLIHLEVPQQATALLVGASIYGETGTAWISFLDVYLSQGSRAQ